jgi:hypothetical protein
MCKDVKERRPMQINPLMDIHFPEMREAEWIGAMKSRASPPWTWQAHNAFGRSAENGSLYFHWDGGGAEPPCTLGIQRKAPGHYVVQSIVPDEGAFHTISHDQYVRILTEFEERIADPAAETVGGMVAIGTSTHTLEDYFSLEAIRLLKRFCDTSNIADHGTHPSDQERWMEFLLHVHRNEKDVHCDTFGKCLETKGWWPDDGIRRLVGEYDFAQRLLRQSGE